MLIYFFNLKVVYLSLKNFSNKNCESFLPHLSILRFCLLHIASNRRFIGHLISLVRLCNISSSVSILQVSSNTVFQFSSFSGFSLVVGDWTYLGGRHFIDFIICLINWKLLCLEEGALMVMEFSFKIVSFHLLMLKDLS